ncbi:MAG: transporter substrate-binding domain-containing protein [Clostridia bacterium]|nr:transporter substrate-binding domain-containing protein [Clostridia bacterium]
MDNFNVGVFIKRLLCLILGLAALTPALAQDGEKTVRVGWYESPFNITDELGRRSGYAYEYQRKIAAYTGWRYEYVEGTWSELIQMLAQGEIDLMSDVSYMAERTESMLYPNLPMGTETYYIYTALDNAGISAEDASKTDPAVIDTVRRADKIMYENKRLRKMKA